VLKRCNGGQLVGFGNDRVAAEHRRRLPAPELHDDGLWDAPAPGVFRRRAPEVVRSETRVSLRALALRALRAVDCARALRIRADPTPQARLRAERVPGVAHIAHRLVPFPTREHGILGALPNAAGAQQFERPRCERDFAAFLIFGRADVEPNFAIEQINVSDAQPKKLAAPPAVGVAEFEKRLQPKLLRARVELFEIRLLDEPVEETRVADDSSRRSQRVPLRCPA
jgi:hypothetical protein